MKYILELLKKRGKLGAKPADTPIEQHHGLHLESGEFLQEKSMYQRLAGKLIYLTITTTRPGISYAISLVSQIHACPRNRSSNCSA